jgi:site-specific DNA recombinase
MRARHPSAGKAVVYVRVSGQPYGYDPFSPENQRRICRDHAIQEHVEIVAEYQDLAVSGRKDDGDRPGFEASIDQLRRREAEILYVANLDRFSRRGPRHVETLLDEIDRAGGRVVFVADGLDTRHPTARRAIAARAAQARAEADAGSWRQSEWHAHNRRSGLWKRIRPYGYVVRDGKLSPHAAEAPIVRSMVDSFLGGSSLRGIAKRLNSQGVKPPRLVFYEEAMAKGYKAKRPPATSWSYVAVRGILTAPALAAVIAHAGELCRDKRGEPIAAGVGIVTLDERAQILAEFQRRGALHRTRRTTPPETGAAEPRYLLTGFGRCGECGKALQRIETLRGGTYYRCASKNHGQTCRGGLVSGRFLESEVVQRIFDRRLRSTGPPMVGHDLGRDSWEHLPLTRRRAMLAETIREVWVYGADVPVDRRVRIVWVGEEPPPPRTSDRPEGAS